jgi:lysophospholipase L1-like esterase
LPPAASFVPEPVASESAPVLSSGAHSEVKPEPVPTAPPPQQHAAGTSAEGNPLPNLPKFFQGLAALRSKSRDHHVRVLWLGDSHTQADFWTGALRTALQGKFGKGGPGFVHIGWNSKHYRHGGVSIHVEGKWRTLPSGLVSVRKVDDGVFGLGGVRLVPDSNGAKSSIAVDVNNVPGKVRFEVAFRLPDGGDALAISVTGRQSVTATQKDADAGAPSAIRHVLLESPGPGATIEVAPTSGSPQLMGVIIESSEPGVVVDTLGLNGARYGTALAYDEASWVKEVARRTPDLVILAYGSNESSDGKIRPDRHAALVEQLIARVRSAAPATECLVFGPVDRGGKDYEEAVAELNGAQRAAASKSGCAFWSGQIAMGGKGSMTKWEAEEPPLAQADLLHLTSRGYERLGNMLARDILAAGGL